METEAFFRGVSYSRNLIQVDQDPVEIDKQLLHAFRFPDPLHKVRLDVGRVLPVCWRFVDRFLIRVNRNFGSS